MAKPKGKGHRVRGRGRPRKDTKTKIKPRGTPEVEFKKPPPSTIFSVFPDFPFTTEPDVQVPFGAEFLPPPPPPIHQKGLLSCFDPKIQRDLKKLTKYRKEYCQGPAGDRKNRKGGSNGPQTISEAAPERDPLDFGPPESNLPISVPTILKTYGKLQNTSQNAPQLPLKVTRTWSLQNPRETQVIYLDESDSDAKVEVLDPDTFQDDPQRPETLPNDPQSPPDLLTNELQCPPDDNTPDLLPKPIEPEPLGAVIKRITRSKTRKGPKEPRKSYSEASQAMDIDPEPPKKRKRVQKAIKKKPKVKKVDRPEESLFKITICENCGAQFNSYFAFHIHMMGHDEAYQAPCHSCDQKFGDINALRSHIVESHFESKPCPVDRCGFTSTIKAALTTHIIRMHKDQAGDLLEGMIICETCGKLINKSKRTDHLCEPILCEKCGQSFMAKKSLKKHLENIHGEKKYKCEIGGCHAKFGSEYALKEHVSGTHNPTSAKQRINILKSLSFQTQTLDSNHTRKWQSINAKKDLNVSRDFICDVCGKGYTSQDSLNHHKDYHNPNSRICVQRRNEKALRYGLPLEELPPLKIRGGIFCDICSKKFANSAILKAHNALFHTEYKGKVLKCPVQGCSAKSNHPRAINTHIRAEHQEYAEANGLVPTLKCDFCEKVFRYARALRDHRLSHTDPESVTCSICKKFFSNFHMLRQHKKMHE